LAFGAGAVLCFGGAFITVSSPKLNARTACNHDELGSGGPGAWWIRPPRARDRHRCGGENPNENQSPRTMANGSGCRQPLATIHGATVPGATRPPRTVSRVAVRLICTLRRICLVSKGLIRPAWPIGSVELSVARTCSPVNVSGIVAGLNSVEASLPDRPAGQALFAST
jgi:hypothetical protein